MPLEIRELVIKLVVEDGGSRSNSSSNSSNMPGGEAENRLVNICVDKVIEILNDKKER